MSIFPKDPIINNNWLAKHYIALSVLDMRQVLIGQEISLEEVTESASKLPRVSGSRRFLKITPFVSTKHKWDCWKQNIIFGSLSHTKHFALLYCLLKRISGSHAKSTYRKKHKKIFLLDFVIFFLSITLPYYDIFI